MAAVRMTPAGALVERIGGSGRPAVELGRYPSAVTLIVDALAGGPFGTPAPWRRAATSRLDARDLGVLEPFARSRPDELPSCLCVLTHRTRSGHACLDEDVERIASMPPDQLLRQVPNTPAWEPVMRDPKRWLHRFAHAMRRACHGIQGPWDRAAGMLDREAERVEAAIAGGTERELLATRLPNAVVECDAIVPEGADVADRLAIVLLLGGAGSSHARSVDGRITHVVYPVTDAWRIVDEDAAPPAALEALLGEQRARLLRVLDRPTTAGRLAEVLHAVPSAATHHLAILEKAGLVERERDGRRVLVHRTRRGTELLALYDSGSA